MRSARESGGDSPSVPDGYAMNSSSQVCSWGAFFSSWGLISPYPDFVLFNILPLSPGDGMLLKELFASQAAGLCHL